MIDLKNNNDKTKIVIVGVGGTGSHLVSFLTHLVGNNDILKSKTSITLVDGDTVEEHNLITQKFLPNDVTKKKSEVLADRYSSVFDLSLTYVDEYLESRSQLEDILDEYGVWRYIVVGCVDNNKARRVMDDTFNNIDTTRDLIYIDAGNSSGEEELSGQVIVSYKRKGVPVLPSPSNYFELKDEEVKTISCGERLSSEIQNIGANITSACTVFNILNSILSFNKIPGDVFTFNATDLNSKSMKVNQSIIEKKKESESFLNRITA